MSWAEPTLNPLSAIEEAARQVNICNACRYCEGYCSVFPAITSARSFAEADIVQLANLCHNCRGCFYACQYAPPHEFGLNLPKALAEVRQESWEDFAFPRALGRGFHRSGVAIAVFAVLGFALLFALSRFVGGLGEAGGQGFYRLMSHTVMVSIFTPAFVLPLLALAVALGRYWRHVGGRWPRVGEITRALHAAATMKNLAGGHGEGCNFEDEDRYSNLRRWLHQAAMYGFILCFLSTSSGTVLHYGFDWPAPYPFWSLPKIFGVSGGILLTLGCFGLAWLKTRADPALGDARVWGGEMGFVLLLGAVGLSGLLLYWLGGGPLLAVLLALHLGTVLAFFLLLPYSKMAHGFYRLLALVRDEQRHRDNGPEAP
ncbi:MAG: tricarballylate utilization 4Fe-4S protein TcuB [Alphaproteobacteria bacterium]|nr:tricarballylate utilization 4Fe-4S protein TcuB [Alphaproteobacteria bacterium]